MATMPMSIADQEISPAEDLGDRTPREDTEERQAQETGSTVRDVDEDISTPEAHIPEPDQAVGEESQETPSQEMDNALPDASLHECRVAMVPLKDIYVESDAHDDDLVTALADSIAHIGLQNPICVVKNDLPENDTPYRIVSGRQRYQAYKSLGQENIPCHILSYDEEAFADEKKQLAQYEENLLRKQLTLLETCTLLGKAKEAYLKMYPDTGQGKASPKNPGTGRLPYTRVASEMLGKSKSTIEKYLQIYDELIAPRWLEALQAVEHPMLHRVEDVSELAKSKDDIPALVEILCQDSDKTVDKFCSLQDAQQTLKHRKEAETLRKAQEATQNPEAPCANTTKSQESDTTESPGEPTVDQTSTDATTPPSPDEALISTQHSETSAWNTSSSEELTTVEDVLIGLEEHVNVYLRDKNIFKRFKVVSHKLPNELRIIVRSR